MTNNIVSRLEMSWSTTGQRVVAGVALLALTTVSDVSAQQREFGDPKEASSVFIEALRSDDLKALESILGANAKGLIESGDPLDDSNDRTAFVTAYDKRSAIVKDTPERATLTVGEDAFPFPIPIVKHGSAWRFDTEAGREEILDRRIGQNELNTIQAARAFVDAQRDYATFDRDGDGILEYAQRAISTEGQTDGLYWPAEPGEEPSPLGPVFAAAEAAGYQVATNQTPGSGVYYGYHFKILTAQGAHASGGAMDYRVKDDLIGGVGLVAFPATYGASGIMSFIVNHEGNVYQADLGPDSGAVVEKMTQYDPDPAVWKAVPADTASNVPQ
jgi:hypothetical protein